MATLNQIKNNYSKNTHAKRSRQGCGQGTKTGRKKGSIKKYRGQGGKNSKSRKH